MTLDIQLDLKAKDILPHTHLVDLGYIDAGILVASQDEFGLDLVGPAKGDYKWQARAGEGFAAENFQIDWLKQQAICPANKESISWTTAFDRFKLEVEKVKFSQKDCVPCLFRPECTHAKKNPRRTITLT
jgi:transposase